MFHQLHLDYLSCLLTIVSTVLVGRRMWQGWLVAGANSVIIAAIGLSTGQWGFVPANLFCIGIYLLNIRSWRRRSPSPAMSGTLNGQAANPAAWDASTHRPRRFAFAVGDERLARNRIRARSVPNQRESRSPL